MSEFNITIEGGTSKRLPTSGKYVDRDIIITALGGGGGGGGASENLDAILTEQEALIEELKATLRGKIAGGAEDLEAVLLEQEALIEELKAVLFGKLNGL